MTIDTFINFIKEVKISFNGDSYVTSDNYLEKVSDFNIPYDEYGNEIRLKLKECFERRNLKYSPSLKSEFKVEDLEDDIYVFDAPQTLLKYSSKTRSIEFLEGNDQDLLLQFNNLVSYFTLFSLLKSKNFSDYYNDANNEIVIYNAAYGIYRILYDTIPNLPSKLINQDVENLMSVAVPIEIMPYFKNAVFALSNGSGFIKLNEILDSSSNIVVRTKRDFELASKKFDFEKFKDYLYKEKEKYFVNIREVIGKIFSQAIGIPISITATVFASYKVTGEFFMLLIVLVSFLVYAVFYIRIQLFYRADISQFRLDSSKDFELIKLKSGLPRDVVDGEINKIENKIKSSLKMIDWLIVIVSILTCLVVVYLVCQLFVIPQSSSPFNFLLTAFSSSNNILFG